MIGNGDEVGTSCPSGRIYLWSTADPSAVRVIDASGQPDGERAAVAFDGSWIAVGHDNGVIELFDVASGARRATLQAHEHAVQGMHALADGGLVSCSLDNVVRRWSPSLEPRGAWRASSSIGLLDAMIDPRNRFAIAGGDDDALHRWELPSGRELPPLPGHTDSIWSVDISADGAHAATASSDGSARLWSTANWSSVPLRGPDGP